MKILGLDFSRGSYRVSSNWNSDNELRCQRLLDEEMELGWNLWTVGSFPV